MGRGLACPILREREFAPCKYTPQRRRLGNQLGGSRRHRGNNIRNKQKQRGMFSLLFLQRREIVVYCFCLAAAGPKVVFLRYIQSMMFWHKHRESLPVRSVY